MHVVRGDDAFGLTVARHVGPTTFHAPGYALNAGASLREAFERLLRSFAVVSDAAGLESGLHAQGYRFAICVRLQGEPPADEATDAFIALHIGLCRVLHPDPALTGALAAAARRRREGAHASPVVSTTLGRSRPDRESARTRHPWDPQVRRLCSRQGNA